MRLITILGARPQIIKAAAISRALPASASCAVFGYANGGNGDYVQIECYDNGLSQYRRAWVPVSMVSGLILY